MRGDYLENGVWRSDRYWVSHINYQPEVLSNLSFPDKIVFHDVTLRDGEQTPGVVFRRDEKIKIAEALDAVGVDRIEAGMPIVSSEDLLAVKEITSLGLKAKVYAFCRLRREDIDAARQADVGHVIVEGPVGYPKLKYQYGWDEETIASKATESIEYAASHGLRVSFFGVDSTRADTTFLIELLKRLEEGVESFVVADTYGSLTPEGARYLFKVLKRHVRRPLEFHGHNDFGMATATSIAALASGAEVVHVSVNGLGERAGNAALEEVALSLRLLYNISLSLNFAELYELSRMVEKLSNFRLSSNKPVVGEGVFTRESGVAIAGWIKYQLGSEAYLPELVGNTHRVVLGKKSGKHSIEWKLKQLNLPIEQADLDEILRYVKARSEAKKGPLTDEEFVEIIRNLKAQGPVS